MPITTLADVVREHAAQRGDPPALRYSDRTWSYAELRDESARVARAPTV